MKKICFILLIFLSITGKCFAAGSTGTATVTGTMATDVKVETYTPPGPFIINAVTGNIEPGAITPSFKIMSNQKPVMAKLYYKVPTTGTAYDTNGWKGVGETGQCVLAKKGGTTVADVNNALNGGISKNAIAYDVSFSSNIAINPAFQTVGPNIYAVGVLLEDAGTNTVTVNIGPTRYGSSYEFSNDESGNYTAEITCTIQEWF